MSDQNTSEGGGMLRTLQMADRLMNAIERGIMALVSTIMIVIMVTVSLDAIFRYTLNQPLEFNYDLVQMYLLPAVMLLPVGFMMRRGGHISVDLFAMSMPARARQLTLGFALLAAAPVFGLMSMRIGFLAFESWQAGLATTGVINWPIWASQAIFCIAMGGLALRLAHIGVNNLIAFLTGRSELEISVLPSDDDPSREAI
ncbi:MAG: TRAP transporter small permease subunit [Burkholderiaceae bacterium]